MTVKMKIFQWSKEKYTINNSYNIQEKCNMVTFSVMV